METCKVDFFGHEELLYHEWLATNGLGGFACGSLSGAPTRKYHALLVAALPSPFGRTIMLNYVQDKLIVDGSKEVALSHIERQGETFAADSFPLIEFSLEYGMPTWKYEYEGVFLEKSLFLIHMQNTLHVTYSVSQESKPVTLNWRPFFHFRTNDQPANISACSEYVVHAFENKYEINCPLFPPLRLTTDHSAVFTLDSKTLDNIFYEIEFRRGYPYIETLSSPGYYSITLNPGQKITFIASTEPWETIAALSAKEALLIERKRKKSLLRLTGNLANVASTAKLVLAADQFIITPITRHEDMIRLQAAGEQAKSIIAGYPWFTDWGRDTMISLEGLTLSTNRLRTAYSILQTFAYYVKDGLIPNMFPDGENEGLYHTADATLWFFHAAERYMEVSGDSDILELLLPKFLDIIKHHIRGTLFGIKVDQDGLLSQGQEGYQLTWMDAKVDDWVVTPRRGKAVEINALWYNALRLLESWTGKKQELADKCYESFNREFWNEETGCLYDVIGENQQKDASIRPNQLFAISLKHSVLEPKRWKPVIETVQKELLTPFGLRTLSPKDPNFKAAYDGDLRARDAAYHQGTVWPWLIGPFIDAWLKVFPGDFKSAQFFLKDLVNQIDSHCVGSVGEVNDALEPFKERGTFAQAWSVAEILRSFIKVYPDLKP